MRQVRPPMKAESMVAHLEDCFSLCLCYIVKQLHITMPSFNNGTCVEWHHQQCKIEYTVLLWKERHSANASSAKGDCIALSHWLGLSRVTLSARASSSLSGVRTSTLLLLCLYCICASTVSAQRLPPMQGALHCAAWCVHCIMHFIMLIVQCTWPLHLLLPFNQDTQLGPGK